MSAERVRAYWGVVFLVGLIATQYILAAGGYGLTDIAALWLWLAVIVISTYHIGKSMGKMSMESVNVWRTTLVLFVVLVGSMLLHVWSAGPGTESILFFAFYFILYGAAMFAAGHESKKSSFTSLGLIYIALGLVFPGWFNSAPFLAAALLIGIPQLQGFRKSK